MGTFKFYDCAICLKTVKINYTLIIFKISIFVFKTAFSGDLYCFGRGRMVVKCYDDHMEGYGSGSMGGYGSGSMGSGYGSGSMGSGSGSMGSGYGMGSGMESGYGYGSEGYGPGGYGSDFSSTSPSS